MLLQLKFFVAKDRKILDTILHKDYFLQPDSNIGYIKNGFSEI